MSESEAGNRRDPDVMPIWGNFRASQLALKRRGSAARQPENHFLDALYDGFDVSETLLALCNNWGPSKP